MAYTAPKWTQMTAPSGATSVNAITAAGDLFNKAMESASKGRENFDSGVEARLQDDSDVNTAALRRQLEGATTLDELNAMQGQISAEGLQGYGKRIDADALSQSFNKERGVMRGEFEQNFREGFSQRMANSVSPEDFAAREAELTQANVDKPWLNISQQITNVGAGRDNAVQVQDINNLTLDLQSNTDVADLKAKRAASQETGSPNWQAMDSLYDARIKEVEGIDATVATNTLNSELRGLTYAQLTARGDSLDKKGDSFGKQFKLITDQQGLLLKEEQESYNRGAEQQLRDAAAKGPKEYQKVKGALQSGNAKGSDNTLLDTGVINQLNSELKGIAKSNGSKSVITNAINQQQELFKSNDSIIDSAISGIKNASEYVNKDANGQIIFSSSMPAEMKQQVMDDARAAGYSPPPKGLVNSQAFIEDLVNVQGFDQADAVQMAELTNQTLFSRFDAPPAAQDKIDSGTATFNDKLAENLAAEDVIYKQVEKLKDFSDNEVAAVVGNPELGAVEWARANIKSGGFFEPTWGKDFEEILPQINDVLRNGVRYKGNSYAADQIPKNVLRLVLSKYLGPNNTVDMDSGELQKLVYLQMQNTDDVAALERHVNAYGNMVKSKNAHKLANARDISILTTNSLAEFNIRRANTAKAGTVLETEFTKALRLEQDRLAAEAEAERVALDQKVNGPKVPTKSFYNSPGQTSAR